MAKKNKFGRTIRKVILFLSITVFFGLLVFAFNTFFDTNSYENPELGITFHYSYIGKLSFQDSIHLLRSPFKYNIYIKRSFSKPYNDLMEINILDGNCDTNISKLIQSKYLDQPVPSGKTTGGVIIYNLHSRSGQYFDMFKWFACVDHNNESAFIAGGETIWDGTGHKVNNVYTKILDWYDNLAFKYVVSTFKFINKDPVSLIYNTYRNDVFGFTFNYPKKQFSTGDDVFLHEYKNADLTTSLALYTTKIASEHHADYIRIIENKSGKNMVDAINDYMASSKVGCYIIYALAPNTRISEKRSADVVTNNVCSHGGKEFPFFLYSKTNQSYFLFMVPGGGYYPEFRGPGTDWWTDTITFTK